MRQRKLAILGSSSSVHVQRWAAEFKSRGWDITVVSADPDDVIGVQNIKISAITRNIDWLFKIGEVSSLLNQISPDLIQAHYIPNYGLVSAFFRRAPVVMTAWGSDILISAKKTILHRMVARWILSRANYVTADSQVLIDEIKRLTPNVPCQQITWGVELSRFHPTTWHLKTGFHVVSLRNWEALYQIEKIILALSLVKKTKPESDVILHLMGKGTQEISLQRLVTQHGLENSVIFHGFLDDAGMAEVMANAKLSISIPLSDSTSVALLESMSSGLAVIGSDIPANREWLDSSVLVRTDSPDALANRWLEFINNEEEAAYHGQLNRSIIVQKADRKQQMDLMQSIYENVLSRRAAL